MLASPLVPFATIVVALPRRGAVVRLGVATHDPKHKKVAFDCCGCCCVRATRFEDFGLWRRRWRRLGDLERAMPNDHDRRSSVAVIATAAAAEDDDFKLVVFKIGNADFDFAAWVWVRDFDLAGDSDRVRRWRHHGLGAERSGSKIPENPFFYEPWIYARSRRRCSSSTGRNLTSLFLALVGILERRADLP